MEKKQQSRKGKINVLKAQNTATFIINAMHCFQ